AIGMVRRNVTVVSKEEPHFFKGKLRAKRLSNEKRVKRFRSRTSRHGYAEDALFFDCSLSRVREDGSSLPGDGSDVRKDFNGAIQARNLLGVFGGGARGAVSGERLVGFYVAPGTAVARHHFVGLFRTPATSRIIWKIASGKGFPNIEHRLDNTPAGFH